VELSGATTTNNYAMRVENLSTNTTTDGINKYGLYVNSAGSFAGLAGTATNNYGLFVSTPSGADNNYAAVFQGGNVGIGTTSPTEDLHIFGAGVAGATMHLETNNSGDQPRAYLKISNSSFMTGYLGLVPNSNSDPENNSYAGAIEHALLLG